MYVRNLLITPHSFLNTKGFTLERNPMNVTGVRRSSETTQALKYIKESILGRSPINVMCVGKPTSHIQALLTIKVPTLARHHILVMNVEKLFSQAEL